MGQWCCSINAKPPAKFHGSRYADTKIVLDSREAVEFLASAGRPESLEVLMQNYDLDKDGNVAFQEAQFLWEHGAEMQSLQHSITAAAADTKNVLDSGELVQFLVQLAGPDLLRFSCKTTLCIKMATFKLTLSPSP